MSSTTEHNQEDLYLESYAFTTAASIIGSVDRKVTVLLRDGRNLFGILRTFDQYVETANLVLQDTTERIYLPNQEYAERYHEIFLIRGENVVMMGELDIDKEDLPLLNYTLVDFKKAELFFKLKNEERIEREKKISKKMDRFGLTSEFMKSDLY